MSEYTDYENKYKKELKDALNEYKNKYKKDATEFDLFKLQLRSLCNTVDVNGDCVYNDDLEEIDFNKIRLIVVGINPGKEEKEDKIYFSHNSDTGCQIRLFFLMNKKLGYKFNGDKHDNVLGLNLTPISTSEEKKLKKTENRVIFSENQMANIICELSENNVKIKIWFVNKSYWKNNKKFQNRYGAIKDRILVFGHPGKRGDFWVDIYKYYNDHNYKNFSLKNILEKVGKENRENL